MSELEQLLRGWEDNLQSLSRRHYVLAAFVAELEKTSRGKRFNIWNDIVWLLLLDCRDALVIHLASWAKAVYEPGGLIGKLQASHTSAFKGKRTWGRDKDDDYLQATYDKHHRECFLRLFPSGEVDFARLRDCFAETFRPALDDRHQNRAHPYEHKRQGTSEMLDLTEVRELLTYAERFLNDLRGVSRGSHLGYGEMGWTSSEDAAEDLVDALLLGARTRRELVTGDVTREDYYADRHTKHDARGDREAVLFNDNWPEDDAALGRLWGE